MGDINYVAGWIMEKTNAKILFVGDERCQISEHAICAAVLRLLSGQTKDETNSLKLSDILTQIKKIAGGNRIICRSGSMSIRETLAFIPHADLVIGPETGVLNAAAMLPVPKIVFLSHSSEKNLTRDWRNCTAFPSQGCPDSPCHRMHYSHDYCPQDEDTLASLCAAALNSAL